jgi:hypothetical protein
VSELSFISHVIHGGMFGTIPVIVCLRTNRRGMLGPGFVGLSRAPPLSTSQSHYTYWLDEQPIPQRADLLTQLSLFFFSAMALAQSQQCPKLDSLTSAPRGNRKCTAQVLSWMGQSRGICFPPAAGLVQRFLFKCCLLPLHVLLHLP